MPGPPTHGATGQPPCDHGRGECRPPSAWACGGASRQSLRQQRTLLAAEQPSGTEASQAAGKALLGAAAGREVWSATSHPTAQCLPPARVWPQPLTSNSNAARDATELPQPMVHGVQALHLQRGRRTRAHALGMPPVWHGVPLATAPAVVCRARPHVALRAEPLRALCHVVNPTQAGYCSPAARSPNAGWMWFCEA